MTKSKLIEQIATKSRLPKKKAEHIMDCIFDTMEQSLKHGRRIEIRGFGSFEVRRYKAYQGRNPRTGAVVSVQPKKLPFFKVGKELRERMNRSISSTNKKGESATAKKSKGVHRSGMAA